MQNNILKLISLLFNSFNIFFGVNRSFIDDLIHLISEDQRSLWLQEKSVIPHTFFNLGENRSILNSRRNLFDFLSIDNLLESVSQSFSTPGLGQLFDDDASCKRSNRA